MLNALAGKCCRKLDGYLRFVTGVPITGDEFVGRQREIKEIKYLVTHGQSVILTAPRRYGKTPLILKILF